MAIPEGSAAGTWDTQAAHPPPFPHCPAALHLGGCVQGCRPSLVCLDHPGFGLCLSTSPPPPCTETVIPSIRTPQWLPKIKPKCAHQALHTLPKLAWRLPYMPFAPVMRGADARPRPGCNMTWPKPHPVTRALGPPAVMPAGKLAVGDSVQAGHRPIVLPRCLLRPARSPPVPTEAGNRDSWPLVSCLQLCGRAPSV